MNRVALVLAGGNTYYGDPFGAPAPPPDAFVPGSDLERLSDVGEVVFNTAMCGYGEVLTDPSYTGQIVVMTYPHIGNYGIDESWSESGPERNAREDQSNWSGAVASFRAIKPAGLVVRDLYTGPVPAGRETLTAYLQRNGVPGVTGIDTRALTLDLRTGGSRNGVLCTPTDGRELTGSEMDHLSAVLREFPAMEGRGLLAAVGTREPVRLPGTGGPHVALYDCGTKANIVRELQALGCTITLLPSNVTAGEIRDTGAAALMLSNGPGDPAVLRHQVVQTRELLGSLPLLGICLGHQIIAEAAGAKTFKMTFGHHGVNHPVREELPPADRDRGRVFVTSQNHGFSVDENTLPPGLHVWFRNANDHTVEGLRDDQRGIKTTQFHPESAPGPADARWIFSAFLEGI